MCSRGAEVKALMESLGRGYGRGWSWCWRIPRSRRHPGLIAATGHPGADLLPRNRGHPGLSTATCHFGARQLLAWPTTSWALAQTLLFSESLTLMSRSSKPSHPKCSAWWFVASCLTALGSWGAGHYPAPTYISGWSLWSDIPGCPCLYGPQPPLQAAIAIVISPPYYAMLWFYEDL